MNWNGESRFTLGLNTAKSTDYFCVAFESIWKNYEKALKKLQETLKKYWKNFKKSGKEF